MRRLGMFEGGILDPDPREPVGHLLDGTDCPTPATLRHPRHWVGLRPASRNSVPHISSFQTSSFPAPASAAAGAGPSADLVQPAKGLAPGHARPARLAARAQTAFICQTAMASTLATVAASSLFYWEKSHRISPDHKSGLEVALAEVPPSAPSSAPTPDAPRQVAPGATQVAAASAPILDRRPDTSEPATEAPGQVTDIARQQPEPSREAADLPKPGSDVADKPRPRMQIADGAAAPGQDDAAQTDGVQPGEFQTGGVQPRETQADAAPGGNAVAAPAPGGDAGTETADTPPPGPIAPQLAPQLAPQISHQTAPDTAPLLASQTTQQIAHAPRLLKVTAMTRLSEMPEWPAPASAPAFAQEPARHRSWKPAAHVVVAALSHAEPRQREARAPVTNLSLPHWLTANRAAPRKVRVMSEPFHTLTLPRAPSSRTETKTTPAPRPARQVVADTTMDVPDDTERAAPAAHVAAREDAEPALRPPPASYARPRSWYGGSMYRGYPGYAPYQGYGGPYGYYGSPYGRPGYAYGYPYRPPPPPSDVTID